MEIIGGADTKDLVKRILERVFANVLAKNCSWTGFSRDCLTGEPNCKLQNI